MKFVIQLLLFISVSAGLGQANDAFVYRAAVLDLEGNARSNENFEVAIRIQDGVKPNEKLFYVERHSVVTDSIGWYKVKVGSGETGDMYQVLSDVNWKKEKKQLYAIVTQPDGKTVSRAITEILDSPAISFASNVSTKALLTLNCIKNLEALREFGVPESGDMVCVKGHTSVRDGGEGFFYFDRNSKEADDDGIIIKPKGVDRDNPGRWLRDINGPINVNFYGVLAGRNNQDRYTSANIQKAINFAALNTAYNQVNYRAGNTVFFPSGEYFIDGSLLLKSGVSILGEESTLLTVKKGADFDYFFKMNTGKIFISMENLRINGNGEANVGGLYLKSKDGADGTGGLWQSRFKNINIVNIQGHGIFLEGSDSMGVNGPNDYSLPNQMTVFENVRVTRMNDEKNSLRMTLYQGQFTFINCLFLGKRDRSSLGTNVYMSQPGGNVVSFINCTIQEAVHGFKMIGSSNITIDNCWFENLYNSIDVTNGQSINILNSRFSNAAGYGSEGFTGPVNLPIDIETGSIVSSLNSNVNVERNYVRVTDVNSPEAHKSHFIFGRTDSTLVNTNTINSRNNTFMDPRISRTIGIVQSLPVETRTINLNGRTNVAADFGNNTVLRKIESTLSGGEQLTMAINKQSRKGTIKIKDWAGVRRKGNISLNGQKQLVLKNGQKATFLKVDAPLSNNGDQPIYKLVSVSN